MTEEPQVGFWHPMFLDEPDRTPADIARFVSLLGPFLDTYSGLTVDAYWQLTVSEHSAMTQWLYTSGVLADPSSTKTPGEVSPEEPAPAGL